VSVRREGVERVKLDLRRSGPFIGMAGMATTFFLYAWSAVVVRDVLTLVVLPLCWLALLALAAWGFSNHPYLVLVAPVVATSLWFAVLLT
jgi:hypothetical protein